MYLSSPVERTYLQHRVLRHLVLRLITRSPPSPSCNPEGHDVAILLHLDRLLQKHLLRPGWQGFQGRAMKRYGKSKTFEGRQIEGDELGKRHYV